MCANQLGVFSIYPTPILIIETSAMQVMAPTRQTFLTTLTLWLGVQGFCSGCFTITLTGIDTPLLRRCFGPLSLSLALALVLAILGILVLLCT